MHSPRAGTPGLVLGAPGTYRRRHVLSNCWIDAPWRLASLLVRGGTPSSVSSGLWCHLVKARIADAMQCQPSCCKGGLISERCPGHSKLPEREYCPELHSVHTQGRRPGPFCQVRGCPLSFGIKELSNNKLAQLNFFLFIKSTATCNVSKVLQEELIEVSHISRDCWFTCIKSYQEEPQR